MMTGNRVIRAPPRRGKPKLGPLQIDEYTQALGRMVGMIPRRPDQTVQ